MALSERRMQLRRAEKTEKDMKLAWDQARGSYPACRVENWVGTQRGKVLHSTLRHLCFFQGVRSSGLPCGLRWERVHLPCRRPRFSPWIRKIPWRRKWQPTPVLFPGESHGHRGPAGCTPWGRKKADTTEWLTLSHFSKLWPVRQMWFLFYFVSFWGHIGLQHYACFTCTSCFCLCVLYRLLATKNGFQIKFDWIQVFHLRSKCPRQWPRWTCVCLKEGCVSGWSWVRWELTPASPRTPSIPEEDPMGPSQDRPLYHALLLPLVCRKTLVRG